MRCLVCYVDKLTTQEAYCLQTQGNNLPCSEKAYFKIYLSTSLDKAITANCLRFYTEVNSTLYNKQTHQNVKVIFGWGGG